MKIDDLENYSLQITEKYMRYYYSSKAQIIKNVTTQYDLKENLEIPTSVSSIVVTSFLSAGDEIYGIYLEYYDKNSELKTVELNFDSEIEIELTIGNNDIFRTSLCTLKIVEK